MTGRRHSCSKLRDRKRKLTIMLDRDDAGHRGTKEVVSRLIGKLLVQAKKGS